MQKQNEATAGVSQRIGERLRELRVAGAWDQETLAAVLTQLGLPTKPATIGRIESGAQPITLEQLLLLGAVLHWDGLMGLLTPPFVIGHFEVRSGQDVLQLVAPPHRLAKGSLKGEMAIVAQTEARDQRNLMIARTLRRDPAEVGRAESALYGKRSAHDVIGERFQARLDELEPRPAVDSRTWRAHMSHAVRQVTREIQEHLEAQEVEA